MISKSERYLFGEELTRITLEGGHVGLIFQKYGIQLIKTFRLEISDREYAEVDVLKKTGNINLLWEAIGFRVVELEINAEFRLIFDNNLRIISKCNDNVVSGTIQTLDLKMYDEF